MKVWRTIVASSEDITQILSQLSTEGFTLHSIVGRADGCYLVVAYQEREP